MCMHRRHQREIRWAPRRIPKRQYFLDLFSWANQCVQRVSRFSVLQGEAGLSLAARVLIAWQQRGLGALATQYSALSPNPPAFHSLPSSRPLSCCCFQIGNFSGIISPESKPLLVFCQGKGRSVGFRKEMDGNASIQSKIFFLVIPKVYQLTNRERCEIKFSP